MLSGTKMDVRGSRMASIGGLSVAQLKSYQDKGYYSPIRVMSERQGTDLQRQYIEYRSWV